MILLFRLILISNFIVAAVLLHAQGTGGSKPQSAFAKCLPPDVMLSDVVDTGIAAYIHGQPAGTHTVEQKLSELKATCDRDNKLVDGNGKQIVFYHLTGCWGNPPDNYQDILKKQQDELNKLKQQYTVIELSCNPSGLPIS